MLEHLYQTRLIQWRIGVRRTCQCRDAAATAASISDSSWLVFITRFAQTRGKVDQAGATTRPVASITCCATKLLRAANCSPLPATINKSRSHQSGFSDQLNARLNLDIHCPTPAKVLITAMRTAMQSNLWQDHDCVLRNAGIDLHPRFIGPGASRWHPFWLAPIFPG